MGDSGTTPSPEELRAELQKLIVDDLLGPVGGPHEQVEGRIGDRYLLGMLAPAGVVAHDGTRDDEAVTHRDDATGGPADTSPGGATMAPSSMGLSFAVAEGCPGLKVAASWGRYMRERADAPADVDGESPPMVWQRHPTGGEVDVEVGADGPLGPFDVTPDAPGVVLRGRVRTSPTGARLVTLFLVNEQSPAGPKLRHQWWLFQPELVVAAADGATQFVGRRDALGADAAPSDPEERSLDLLYRRHAELAVGHGVAVEAERDPDDPWRARLLRTVVAPTYEVAHVEAPSASEVPALAAVALDMKVLSETATAELAEALMPLADAYDAWLDTQATRVGDIADGLDRDTETAMANVETAKDVARRLRRGIELLGRDEDAAEAFRFANAAMWQQRVHTVAAAARRGAPDTPIADAVAAADVAENRSWRPFQLAFVCLNLPALADPRHTERTGRGLVDLLFFPTGGGKTEAYLGLTAFTLAIRRLQGVRAGHDGGDGVAVLMRYTLRLLTAQQFQRAAALICACELLRRDRAAGGDARWDGTPFRIGMWVGASVTPNRENISQKTLEQIRSGTTRGADAVQLKTCPWCGTEIDAGRNARYDPDRWRTLVFCGDPYGDCPFTEVGSPGEGLPVVTVDETIYRLLPALVIATADKFAQLPWKGEVGMLFGRVSRRCTRHGFRSDDLDVCGDHTERDTHKRTGSLPPAHTVECGPLRPPDLIIQDELHLISGPLGSLVGLSETAVDALATWDCDGTEVRPKVVASTATIRRAPEQVYRLFWRDLAVFPPPVLDADDSFFARARPVENVTGRRYLGICARGSRLKAVETRVFETVMAAAQLLADRYGAAADPWMTCVGYFNALRELGGARRLVDDDVTSRLRRADRRGLARRSSPVVRELTSRVASSEIPAILDELGARHDPESEQRCIDILLATNMISVGVDVSRLGLMVVVGQPKTSAEYIQATSRVGRDRSGPGLVLTIYNWARPRDLNHYEKFAHYHATFYRHVEALSVTPYAPRAIDRGLTSVLVALARQLEPDWNGDGAAETADVAGARMDRIEAVILERAGEVGESASVKADVAALIQSRRDNWLARQAAEATLTYATERDHKRPLLAQPSGERWEEWTCPMSLREVEPNVNLVLRDGDPSLADQPPWPPATTTAAAEATEEDLQGGEAEA